LYVRFRSAVPNRRGSYPGIFGLANGLAADGRLTADDYAWWAATNAVGDALYRDPSRVDPACYDRELNPGAAAWFRSSATELLTLAEGYLQLLDRYGVPWHELRTDRPGHLVYEDDVQVVAVPLRYPEDWPFR
jgi:hypothetical protein